MFSMRHVLLCNLLFFDFVLQINSECPVAYAKSPSPVSKLYAVNDTLISESELVTLQTLGGVWGRVSAPVIYRVGDPLSPYSTWLADIESFTDVIVNYDYLENAQGLIDFLLTSSSFVEGLAVYSDINDISLSNVVRYCAGSNGTIAVTGSDAMQYSSTYGIPILYNGSSEALPATLMFSDNAITFQQPSAQLYLIEYSVFARAPFMAWDNADRDSSLEYLQQRSSGCAAAFGWVGDEGEYVSYLAKYGVFVHASDWAKNMAPLSSIPAASQHPATSHPHPHRHSAENNVHTVTFVMTDGDNFQWLLGGFTSESWFGAPELVSSATPMSFTLSPALMDVAPVVLSHLQNSASTMYSTSFVAAPSGLGYTYPELLSDAERQVFANETAAYMAGTSMRILNILAGGNDISDRMLLRSSAPFLEYSNIDCVFYYTYGNGYAGGGGKTVFTEGGEPVITARYSLWGDNDDPSASPMLSNDGMIAALQQQVKDSSIVDGYSVIPVHAWSHTVSDVKYIIDNIGEGVEILDAESFFRKFTNNVVVQQK
jgi:hypothetical protein